MSQLPNTSRMSLSRKTRLADSLAGLSLRSSLARDTVPSTPGGLAGVREMGRSVATVGLYLLFVVFNMPLLSFRECAAAPPLTKGVRSRSPRPPIVFTKDPCPIQDKAWQASAIRNLISFSANAGFNQQVSPKTLQAPSMEKDFTAIFKFLYAQLDRIMRL
ncbi:hypothetical protein HDU80_000709 [Chytriomyces hyalinus]|nr:hypothetical protein HDU80_000709 [Chytriomyces hyalinus]